MLEALAVCHNAEAADEYDAESLALEGHAKACLSETWSVFSARPVALRTRPGLFKWQGCVAVFVLVVLWARKDDAALLVIAV